MKHDCDNCQASGDCDLEGVMRSCRDAYASGGAAGLGALCVSYLASPVKFHQCVGSALSVLHGDFAEIKEFRKAMLALVPEESTAYYKGVRIVLGILFRDLVKAAFDETLTTVNTLGDALGVGVTIAAEVSAEKTEHPSGALSFADFPEPKSGVLH